MKTAENVAEEFAMDLARSGIRCNADIATPLVKVLTAYAEDYTKGLRRTNDVLIEQARAEALEEAAKVAEKNICGLDVCSVGTAECIRALKDKP